ncbi:MAG: hypothetical protein V4592_26170 [Bacteroidota bacterium]
MQEKVVTVPFNRQAYLNNQQVIWDLMYKEVSPSYYIYIVVTVIVLGVGISIDIKGGLPLTTVVGVCMLISILLRFRHVRTVRRNFFGRAEMMADKYENELGDYTYTFTDQGLTYQDNQSKVEQDWELFEALSIHKHDNLLLYLKEKEPVHYVISREEVGEAIYNEIYGILMNKCPPTS